MTLQQQQLNAARDGLGTVRMMLDGLLSAVRSGADAPIGDVTNAVEELGALARQIGVSCGLNTEQVIMLLSMGVDRPPIHADEARQ